MGIGISLDLVESVTIKGLCKNGDNKPIKAKGFCSTCYNLDLLKKNPEYARKNKLYQKEWKERKKIEDKNYKEKISKSNRSYREKYPDKYHMSMAMSNIRNLPKSKREELVGYIKTLNKSVKRS